MIKRNIIFLDIDGVLNSNFWNENHQREISDGTFIDYNKVELLATLVRKTNSEIVLHSGWKYWFDNNITPVKSESKKLMKILQDNDLTISDITPDFSTENIRRTKQFSLIKAKEILSWLELHPNIRNWIVLDDLDLHNETIKQHQIKTDQTVGLTKIDVDKAVQMLLGSDK